MRAKVLDALDVFLICGEAESPDAEVSWVSGGQIPPHNDRAINSFMISLVPP
jgi:hypothetical protein